MAVQKIGKMSLKNSGGFVARLKIEYMNDEGLMSQTESAGDILLGQTKTVDPSDLGVPDGSLVYMYAFVVWGTDNQAKQAFIYAKGDPLCAHFNISGTTLNNDMGVTGIN